MAIDRRSVKQAWRRLMSLLCPSSLFQGGDLSLPQFRSDLPVNRRSLLQMVQSEANCPLSFVFLGLIVPVIVLISQSKLNSELANNNDMTVQSKMKPELRNITDMTIQIQLAVAAFIAFYCNTEHIRNHWLTDVQSISEVSVESNILKQKLTSKLAKKQKWINAVIIGCFLITGSLRIFWLVEFDTKMWFYWTVLSVFDVISVTYRVAVLLFTALIFQTRCIVQLLRMEEFSQKFDEKSELHNVFVYLKELETKVESIGIDHQLYVGAFIATTTLSELWNAYLLVTRKFDCKSMEVIVSTLYCLVAVLMFLVHAVKIADEVKMIGHEMDKWSTKLTVADLQIGEPYGTQQKMDLMESLSYQMYLSNKRKALGSYLKKHIVGVQIYGYVLNKHLLRTLVMMQISLGAWVLKKSLGF